MKKPKKKKTQKQTQKQNVMLTMMVEANATGSGKVMGYIHFPAIFYPNRGYERVFHGKQSRKRALQDIQLFVTMMDR